MSAPINWPLKNVPIFESDAKEKNSYRLNPNKLSDKECHIFFPIVPVMEELAIVSALEFFTFNPLNKQMNDKFNINAVKIGDIQLWWCSFPIEFKDVCERAAKVFGMTMTTMNKVMALVDDGKASFQLKFPEQNNILHFQGTRCNDQKKLDWLIEDAIQIGKDIEKLGID